MHLQLMVTFTATKAETCCREHLWLMLTFSLLFIRGEDVCVSIFGIINIMHPIQMFQYSRHVQCINTPEHFSKTINTSRKKLENSLNLGFPRLQLTYEFNPHLLLPLVILNLRS